MKIGVIKLGARITWETDAAVGPGEAISICKALKRGGAEVHVITKILKKDTLDPSLTWWNILGSEGFEGSGVDQAVLDNLDALLVINGNVNFFGGAEDAAQIMNYGVINNFKGPVIYVMCDPELPLLQIWENVSKKPWGMNYREADINITRGNIHVLSQPFAVDKVEARWRAKKGTAPIDSVFHFPMERFPLLNDWMKPSADTKVDLLYGGTTRGGRRVPNLFKWYWNLPSDISVEIFGKIDQDDFLKHPKLNERLCQGKLGHVLVSGDTPPAFTGMVKYCDVLPKMNTSIAHLVTGDPSYEELDIIPQRTMECIAAGNVVFIDANMDTSRRIYPPESLVHEFLYVRNQAELVERLRLMKSDPEFRAGVILGQHDAINFDADMFCKSLVEKIAEFT